jgi:hypothetical protein
MLYKIIILFYFLTSFLNLFSSVTTNVSNEDTVEYYYDEVHKEFGIYNWTFCPGEESKTSDKNGNYTSSFQSDKNKGTSTTQFLETAHLGNYRGSSVEWNNFFDSKNYTFNININKKVAKATSKKASDDCVKKRWEIKPNGNKTKVIAKLNLKVPKGVWVVRFHEKIPTNAKTGSLKAYGVANLTDQAKHSSQNTEDYKWVQDVDEKGRPVFLQEKSSYFTGKEISEDYHYYFVVPGETLTVEYQFTDTNEEDSKTNRSLEVMFVGYHHCVIEEEQINSVFSSQNIVSKIQEMQKIVKSNTSTIADKELFHKNINYLACFGDENIVKLFMQKNGYIKGAIKYVDIIDKIREKDSFPAEGIVGPSGVEANNKIPRMALFNHLYQYSVDLNTMCLPSSFNKDKKRIESTLDTLNYISSNLFIDDEDDFNFYFIDSLFNYHKELETFINTLEPDKELSLSDNDVIKLKSLKETSLNFKTSLFTQSEMFFNAVEFPYISSDQKQIRDLLIEISKSYRQILNLNKEILTYLLVKNKERANLPHDILIKIKAGWKEAETDGLLPLKEKLSKLKSLLSEFNLIPTDRVQFYGKLISIIKFLKKITEGLKNNDISNYYMIKEVDKYKNPIKFNELEKIERCLNESREKYL